MKKKRYYIIEHDGRLHWPIGTDGKANPYSTLKIFESFEAAEKWIDAHTYKGMSVQYEIYPIVEWRRLDRK